MSGRGKIALPESVRIEACSLCQLECPLCPRTTGETKEVVGDGYLKFSNFKSFIDANSHIREVELANFGEVFLNPDLPEILKYAYENKVKTTMDEGVNLNNAPNEALEALVRYKTGVVRCAIDGATNESYRKYRVKGELKQVIRNIKKINDLKERYGSQEPKLIFQFVIFNHNEHELELAKKLAHMLNMKMFFKLNFFPGSFPVMDRERIRQYTGYADREEYLEKTACFYCRKQCLELWIRPQINWDGKFMGCSRSFWGTFGPNAFENSLDDCFNGEKIIYARSMLMGKVPLRADMPCIKCGSYRDMKKMGNWIKENEIEMARGKTRTESTVCC